MRTQKGFTLIELLVVIAIIGILATLVITQVAGAQVRARNSSAQSDVTESGKSIEVWKANTFADVVVIKNAANSAAAVPASNLNGTTPTSWPFTGTETAATSYGTSLSKSPSTSYTYGYATDAAGNNYCITFYFGISPNKFFIIAGNSKALGFAIAGQQTAFGVFKLYPDNTAFNFHFIV